MSWTVFNDAARSADQSRAVNERRALIDRLIGHADFYRPGSRQPREGVRFVYVLLRGPGKRSTIAAGPVVREGDWAL
jgi:hypothetical protein